MENLVLTMCTIEMSDLMALWGILQTLGVVFWYLFIATLAIATPFLILWVIGKIGFFILEKVVILIFMAIFQLFRLIFNYILKPLYCFASYRILSPIQMFISNVLATINPIKLIKQKSNRRYHENQSIQRTVMYR